MREFKINNEDYLHSKDPLEEQGVDNNACPRQQGQSSCSDAVCHNRGRCVDEWNTVSCRCAPGFHGNLCQQEFKPFGFGASAYVVSKQKESYQGHVLVSESRRHRAADTSSVFIRFRITNSGLLFYSERGPRSSVLYIDDQVLKYTITESTSNQITVEVKDDSIHDGSWHNATVIITDRQRSTILLMFDDKSSSKSNVQTAFKFSDVHVTQMSLGGTTKTVSVDGGLNDLPSKPGEDEPLGIGVLVVIAFFGVLLIVIVVIFLVYRFHGQRKETAAKQNGYVNKGFGSGYSPGDSGYGDNDFIHQHVNQSIKNSSHYAVSNGRLPSRPDLINVDGRRSVLPLKIDDGTVIINIGDIHLTGNEDSPELYDLENASSIAPSDIDVSYYYGASRHGKGQSYRDNYKKTVIKD
ncbi:FAT4 [Mytilus coruscus]|uniref:FAT4 n=1 Tax=Mytilus coruscus TaxID=42192 RepID=A0A6J8A310_MYTCO|nr:FAT4 [Mytilus coruscus]